MAHCHRIVLGQLFPFWCSLQLGHFAKCVRIISISTAVTTFSFLMPVYLNTARYLTQVYVGKTDEFRISFVGTLAGTIILCTGILVTPIVQVIGTRKTMLIGSVRGLHPSCSYRTSVTNFPSSIFASLSAALHILSFLRLWDLFVPVLQTNYGRFI